MRALLDLSDALSRAVRITPRYWRGRRVTAEHLHRSFVPWCFNDRASPKPRLPIARRVSSMLECRDDTDDGGRLLMEHASNTLGEFKQGAETAFRFISQQMHSTAPRGRGCDMDTSMVDLDVTTPALGSFLDDVRTSWKRHLPSGASMRYRLEHDIDVVVCDVRVREGAAHKQGQILGCWEAPELVNQLTDGGAWEDRHKLLTSEDRRNRRLLGPCRLVADVRFTVQEHSGAVDPASGDLDCQIKALDALKLKPRVHLWQFEIDIGPPAPGSRAATSMPLWRVCNMNDAIEPGPWMGFPPKPYEE